MLTKTMVTLALGLGLSLAAACNGSVATETGSTGAGGDIPQTTVTTGATGTTTGGSTGSGGTCPGFEDAAGSGAVTVRFHNKTGLPVYLPAQCDAVDYTIHPTIGDDGITYNFDGTCLQTCADLQTEPAFACGACAPRSYLLADGATREVTWNGTGLLYGVAMPTACYAQPQGNTCAKIVSAPATNYRIESVGFSTCGAGCTCDPSGVCSGSAEGQQVYADPVKFDFPQANVVDVVFNFCAFGCPDGG